MGVWNGWIIVAKQDGQIIYRSHFIENWIEACDEKTRCSVEHAKEIDAKKFTVDIYEAVVSLTKKI